MAGLLHSNRGLLLIIGPACLVFLLLSCYYAKGGVIDDSFISFRYAENHAAGHGLVFNEGGKPVEGYSNFLWVIALSYCHKAGLDTLIAARIMGVLCGMGVLLVIALIMRISNSSPRDCAFAIASATTAPALAVYAISGMETLFYSLLLVLFLYLFLLEEIGSLRVPLSGFVGGLVCLTRPEGFVVLSIFVPLRILQAYSDRGKKWIVSIWLVEIVVIFLPFLLWRYWYYGYLLPMPVYAKATGEYLYRGVRQILGGGRYFLSFAKTYGGGGIIILLIISCIRCLWGWRPTNSGFSCPPMTILSGFFLWYIIFVINVGGDWMPQFRFFVPLLPLMYILISNPDFLQIFAGRYAIVFSVTLLIFNILLIPLVLNPTLQNVEPYVQYAGISVDPTLSQRYQQIGILFRGKTLATTECGMLPYYSQMKTLDMMGLNDDFIAMAFHKNRGAFETSETAYDEILEYVFRQSPDLIHIGGGLLNNEPYYRKLLHLEAFKSNYSLCKECSVGSDQFYLHQVPSSQR